MSLFYKSKPYRIVAGDAKSGTLSHAYLLVCPDGANLRAFLKELAVLVAGGDERRDRLIREERFADMAVIPAETGGKIAVGDVRAVIDDAYVNPLESDRKLYVLDALQDAIAAAQNKLNLTASTAVEFARGLVSEKVEGNKFLPLLRLAFRDMLMLRLNRKDLLLFGGERAVLEKAAKRYDERALVFSQEAIGQAERNLKFNANPAMTYETLFIRILEGR